MVLLRAGLLSTVSEQPRPPESLTVVMVTLYRPFGCEAQAMRKVRSSRSSPLLIETVRSSRKTYCSAQPFDGRVHSHDPASEGCLAAAWLHAKEPSSAAAADIHFDVIISKKTTRGTARCFSSRA